MDLPGEPDRLIPTTIRRAGSTVLRRTGRLAASIRPIVRPNSPVDDAVVTPPIEPYADFDIVFDADFYQSQLDEDTEPLTAKEHFCYVGWRAFVDPSPLFHVAWYVDQYPDVMVGKFDPLSDYLLAGWRVGRDPAPWFSTSWYLDQLAGQGLEAENPLVHYCRRGAKLGFTISPQHFEMTARRQRADPSQEPRQGLATITVGTTLMPVETLDSYGSELLSFDMWDTLIERERPADGAKLATTRRLAQHLGRPTDAWTLFQQRVAIEAELAAADAAEEYHAREVIERLAEQAGVDATEISPLGEALYAAEVQDECESTRRREPMATVIANRLSRSAPTAVLSDFYMGADDLGRILASNNIDIAPAAIVSSVDIGASKRLGTAFAELHNRFSVGPDDHLHVGDNPWSDGEQAHRAGIEAALVPPPISAWPGPGQLTRDWFDTVPALLVAEATELVRPIASAHRSSVRERRAISGAGTLTVLAVALVARAIDAALERGLDTVHYVSREGAFLAQVHRLVGRELVGDAAPRPIHIQTSRRASFGPSLGKLDAAGIDLIARQYPRQSFHGLLRSLGLDPDAFANELSILPFDPDEPVELTANLALNEFMERPVIRGRIEAMLGHQQDLLRRYLDARELQSGSVVVDVGWRGSIQDNLSRLTGFALHGVYLGLFPYLNPQSTLVTKEAVAFDGNLGESFGWFDPPAVIESPMTPVIDACVAYAEVDDRVEPVLEAESGRAEKQIDAMQQAAFTIAPVVARRWTLLGVEPTAVRTGLADVIKQVYEAPPAGFADIWFDSGHDDTFGAANVTPYAKPMPSAKLVGDADDDLFTSLAVSTRWPQGYARWLPVETIMGARRLRAETLQTEDPNGS